MPKKLFVGNLPVSTTSEELREFFEQLGSVRNARVMTDLETGRPRGFGFVEMSDSATARSAVEATARLPETLPIYFDESVTPDEIARVLHVLELGAGSPLHVLPSRILGRPLVVRAVREGNRGGPARGRPA